jgi:hypothetical protein
MKAPPISLCACVVPTDIELAHVLEVLVECLDEVVDELQHGKLVLEARDAEREKWRAR